jgi:hypothetical protein
MPILALERRACIADLVCANRTKVAPRRFGTAYFQVFLIDSGGTTRDGIDTSGLGFRV